MASENYFKIEELNKFLSPFPLTPEEEGVVELILKERVSAKEPKKKEEIKFQPPPPLDELEKIKKELEKERERKKILEKELVEAKDKIQFLEEELKKEKRRKRERS
jgi:hypothetical protein